MDGFRGRGAGWGWAGPLGRLGAHPQSTSSLFREPVGDVSSEWVSRQSEPHMSLKLENLKQEWALGASVSDPWSWGSRDPVREEEDIPGHAAWEDPAPLCPELIQGGSSGPPTACAPGPETLCLCWDFKEGSAIDAANVRWAWGVLNPTSAPQRHYFANKGPPSQSHGFSRSHEWM